MKRSILIAWILVACGLSACGGPSMLEKLASPELLYSEAERAMRIGAYDNAIRLYEQLEITHPFSAQARQARLDLVYAYYRNRMPEQAIDAADTFIRENPRDPNVDYAHYLKGLVHFPRDRHFLEKTFRVDLCERPPNTAYRSFASFSTLVQRYPESPYVRDARQRMVFLRNCFARYEVHVAESYMERAAWVAAANRAKHVLENYPEAPSLQRALEILSIAYDKLGIEDLAIDSQRVLVETYPDSKSRKGRRARRKIQADVPVEPEEVSRVEPQDAAADTKEGMSAAR